MDFGKVSSGCYALIMMVQTADCGPLADRSEIWWLDRSCLWRIHCQCEVRTPVVIVRKIRVQHPAQMLLAQYDDVIKRVSAYAADDPLTIGVLPRTLRGNLHLFDPHVFDAGLEGGAIDRVPVSQQVTRRGLSWKRVDYLLSCPCCSWVFGHIAVHDPFSDEVADFFGDGRTARLATLAQSAPVVSESLLLPRQHGVRLHELQGIVPSRPQAREPSPEEPIRCMELRTLDGSLIDEELMPQGDVLEAQGVVRAEA